MAKKKTKEQEIKREEGKRTIRDICRALNGTGCGTEPEDIPDYRKVLTWEEICKRHRERCGD